VTDEQLTLLRSRPSRGQLERLIYGRVQRLTDDVVKEIWGSGDYGPLDLDKLEVWLWRCADAHDGPNDAGPECPGPPGDCGCCDYDAVWESPANVPDWEPVCDCGRKALLVQYVGLWGELRAQRAEDD
jgi:hypothetical protein